MLRMGTELVVPPGTVVASSACGGRQCTLLLKGSFTWSEPDLSGGQHPARCLQAGDFLDEEALSWACGTEDGPGAFWVHADAESRVLVFNRLEFQALVQQAPNVGSLANLSTATHLSAWRPRAMDPSPGHQSVHEVSTAFQAGPVTVPTPEIWPEQSGADHRSSIQTASDDAPDRLFGPLADSSDRRRDACARGLSRWLIAAMNPDRVRTATSLIGERPDSH
jgi:hypothetical protein